MIPERTDSGGGIENTRLGGAECKREEPTMGEPVGSTMGEPAGSTMGIQDTDTAGELGLESAKPTGDTIDVATRKT